jgi:hypothetical protein
VQGRSNGSANPRNALSKTHSRYLATGIVPGAVWAAFYAGAVLTVAFTFFFGAKYLAAQAAMTGILSALVTLGLLVIISMDHPFSGSIWVGSEPLQSVIEDFDRGVSTRRAITSSAKGSMSFRRV